MAATRLVAGVQREIWQEVVAQGGGASQPVPTGIRIGAGQLCRVQGLLTVATPVGSPVFTAALSIVAGRLVVTVANTAAGGNTGTWMLDVRLVQSMSQANAGASGYIMVANGAAGGGIAAPQTLAATYVVGASDVDQRMIVQTAKGGGVTIDCTDAGVTADGVSLEIRQSAAWSMPTVIDRHANDNQGATLHLSRARGTYPVPADLQVGDAIGTIRFVNQYLGAGQFGTLIAASVTDVTGGPATAYDFYATYANVPMNSWRMDRPGANLTRLIGFGTGPGIIPNTTHTGYLGEDDKIWGQINVDDVKVYANILVSGNAAGANADQTIAFRAAGTTEPTATAGLVHVYAWLFAGGGGGTNAAALTVFADEPVLAAQAFADYQVGIPLRYNGKDYYLLARDMSPA
jgi:hypothetical protein